MTALAIPTFGGGRGGVGDDGFDVGEVGDGVNDVGISGMRYLINRTALIRENPASSSSLSREGEIKGLFPNSPLHL